MDAASFLPSSSVIGSAVGAESFHSFEALHSMNAAFRGLAVK